MAQTKGVSITVSGVIFSSYSVFLLLTSPFMAILSNKFGTKAVLLGGILSQGIATVFLGVWDYVESPTLFTILCLLSRIAEGIGASAFYIASHTVAANIFPNNVNFAMGILGISLGVGYCVGPAFGSLLYAVGGYQLPFYTLGGFLLLMFPLNYFLIPGRSGSVSEKSSPAIMWHLLKSKAIIIIGFGLIVEAISWGFLMATMSVHLVQEFNISISQVCIFFFALTGSYGVFSLVWGYVADKYTNYTWLMITTGLLTISLSISILGPTPVFPFQNSLAINYVAIIIWSISIAISYSLSFGATVYYATEALGRACLASVFINARVTVISFRAMGFEKDEKLYAFLSSYNWSVYSFGGLIGPALGSFLVDEFGFPVACTAISILCFFASILMGTYFGFFHQVQTSKL